MVSNQEFYAERGRRNKIADAEWARRQPFENFEVDRTRLAQWAVSTTPRAVSDLPLTRDTAAAWAEALGLSDSYIGRVLDAIAAAAVRDGVLRCPEPGVVKIDFASRDERTEDEVGLGWAFLPSDAQYLIVHARSSVMFDRIAGGDGAHGPSAVAAAIEVAADSLHDPRQGWARYD